MTEPLGGLCIVLHGHLPYVLNHGTQPHGEAWLFEGAAETYLPLLDLLDECAAMGIRPAITIGLTPVLLEQLGHERFKTAFVEYLHERADRARQDRHEFETKGEHHFVELAVRWEEWCAKQLAHFERIGRDIAGAFASHLRARHIQILTSNATHAYMPLLLNDEMLRAQMSCGIATTRRWFGAEPRGMWLPECAYRAANDQWVPPVLYDNPRGRAGVEQFIAEAGISHFFVDNHLIADETPLGTMENGQFKPMNETQIYWDGKRGWRSPLEPVGVASAPEPPRVFVFARHPRVSEQVWSGIIGYPGAAEYLEFHRKHGEGGLRYHRVTDIRMPIAQKQPYEPAEVREKIYQHAQHFCGVVREVLGGHQFYTGRTGVVTAPFDAELFGHWWFEGPQFLREVIMTLAKDPQVTLMTAEEALERRPPDMVARLPEGSWGEKGNHSVWLNERSKWIWEMEYRAEGRFLKLLHALPWQSNGQVREMLTRAARELLLLQASDWPFVIHSKGAEDYGIQRFAGHCTRFDRIAGTAEMLARGQTPGRIEQVQVEEADLHDNVFGEIELGWWMPR